METYQLYRQAKEFGVQPSKLFGIRENAWLAYQFDSAVLKFGTWAENRLHETNDKGKPRYSFARALGITTKVDKVNPMQFMGIGGVLFKD